MKPAAKCAVVEPLLYDYLNSLLDASETERVSQHLGNCARCRMELERWRTFDQAVGTAYPKDANEADVPLDLTEQIMQVVRREAALERVAVPGGAHSPKSLAVFVLLAVLSGVAGVFLLRPIESGSDQLLRIMGHMAAALSNQPVTGSAYGVNLLLWTVAGLLLCYAVLVGCARYVTTRDRVG